MDKVYEEFEKNSNQVEDFVIHTILKKLNQHSNNYTWMFECKNFDFCSSVPSLHYTLYVPFHDIDDEEIFKNNLDKLISEWTIDYQDYSFSYKKGEKLDDHYFHDEDFIPIYQFDIDNKNINTSYNLRDISSYILSKRFQNVID